MDVIEAIKSKDDAIYGKGVSRAEIEKAEKDLGLKFANDYKEYLSRFSLVMYDGHELTGLGKSKRTNVVDVTLERQNRRKHDSWYVLEDTGIDGIIIWQDSDGKVYQNDKLLCESLMEYIKG